MIQLDIVTPTRRIVVGARAPSVILPAADGQIEILPGHTELVTLLGIGVLSFGTGEAKRTFAVANGFAEVRKDKVIVLAEACEESTEIDKGRAKDAFKRAETALGGSLTDEEFRLQESKLHRAIVRQQVAQG